MTQALLGYGKEGHGWLWTDPTRYQDSFLWSQSNGEWAYIGLSFQGVLLVSIITRWTLEVEILNAVD